MTSTARPHNRREQILSEATRLFADKGYQGTSIRGIAGACGISEAAIYRHFENKDRLYEGVIRWKAGQHDIADFLEKMGRGGDIEAVLTRMAEHILSFLETDPELLGLMFNNSVETGPAAAVLFREVRLPYINFLAGELERRMSSGEVREVEPYITSRCFVGMVMDCALSVGVWNKITKFDFVANDVICNNVPIFARGLLGEPASRKVRSKEGEEG
jgi:AcrR family transcriptional regulator